MKMKLSFSHRSEVTGSVLPFLITSVSALFSMNVNSQTAIEASLGFVNRPTPTIGFNTNGHMPANFPTGYAGANWLQPAFVDSVAYLNPGVMRYPGGTNTNHWDWQTGWYQAGYTPPFPAMQIRADEFKVGLDASNAEGLWVMNMETSTAHYETDGLRHVASLGITPAMVELGNEHNLSNSTYTNQLMTSAGYAAMAKAYYDSVKVVAPNAKVCVVGSNTGIRPDWHTQILTANPNIEAFAWHAYLNANNADLVFDVNRSLAVAFGGASMGGSLPNRFNQGGFNLLPAGKEVWVTEYNLWETQVSSSAVIAGTWTHLLYLNGLHDYFLRNSQVTMFLLHSLASIDPWHEAISRQDQHITAGGITMKLLLDVAKGSQTCQDIAFAGNPSMTYGSTNIPKLTGWKFNHVGSEKGFICNYSADTFKVSLAGVFSYNMQFDSYYADTNLMMNGLANVGRYSGSSADSILILPFSFTQISALPVNGVTEMQSAEINLNLFPNPCKDRLTIVSAVNWNDAQMRVVDITGKEVIVLNHLTGLSHQLDVNELNKGLYFLTVSDGSRSESIRFVVE